MRISSRWLLGLVLLACEAQATPFSVTTIAIAGEPAPGADSLLQMETPALSDGGRVAFAARRDLAESDPRGAWIGDGSGPPVLLFGGGEPAPGLGDTIAVPYPGRPIVFGGEHVAAFAEIPVEPPDPYPTLIFGPDGAGGVEPAIQLGGDAPGLPGEKVGWLELDFLLSPDGGLVIAGTTDAPRTVLWGSTELGEPLDVWLTSGPAPSVPGITPGEQIWCCTVAQRRLDSSGTFAFYTGIGFASGTSTGLWTRDSRGRSGCWRERARKHREPEARDSPRSAISRASSRRRGAACCSEASSKRVRA